VAPLSLVALFLLAGAAAYIQTLTGFAFGLIMMGGIGLSGLMPLTDAAVIVGILTFINATQVLLRGWRDVAWTEFLLIIVPSLIFLTAGYALLEYLAGASLVWLRLLLGLVIVGSSIQLALRPAPLAQRSPSGSFVFFGALGGLLGGLFSTAGPPLIYHLYRQPFAAHRIRETLVMIFAVNAVVRLAIVTGSGNLPQGSTWWALLAAPVVILLTFIAKRWPPPMSAIAIRRAAFTLLLLSGISLAAPALINLVGGLS
jgi:uncharacterized membrane protein YfcA